MEVNFAVHHGVTEIFHSRVSKQSLALNVCIRHIRGDGLDCGILSVNVLYCFGKLVCKAGFLNGGNG